MLGYTGGRLESERGRDVEYQGPPQKWLDLGVEVSLSYLNIYHNHEVKTREPSTLYATRTGPLVRKSVSSTPKMHTQSSLM